VVIITTFVCLLILISVQSTYEYLEAIIVDTMRIWSLVLDCLMSITVVTIRT